MATSRSSTSSSDGARAGAELRRFARATGWLVAPFALAVAAELWLLPLDAFTRRAWEALVVFPSGPRIGLAGPFYPGRRLVTEEEGDLMIGHPDAPRRPAEWRTDRYGFRTDDHPGRPADIVIVGDSLVAGTRLTQDDTLAAVMERSLRRRVYPYAPASVGEVLVDPRFRESRPAVVLLVAFERSLRYFEPLDSAMVEAARRRRTYGWRGNPVWITLRESPWIRLPVVWMNRVRKGNMLQRVRAVCRGRHALQRGRISDGAMLFLEGEQAGTPLTTAEVDRAARAVAGYGSLFAAEGIRFVFAPVPDKETIYWPWPAARGRPSALRRVAARIRSLGGEVVELQPAFEAAAAGAPAGEPLFQPDDTHWSPAGVNVAAREVARVLRVP